MYIYLSIYLLTQGNIAPSFSLARAFCGAGKKRPINNLTQWIFHCSLSIAGNTPSPLKSKHRKKYQDMLLFSSQLATVSNGTNMAVIHTGTMT
jgi:hypothetical protein